MPLLNKNIYKRYFTVNIEKNEVENEPFKKVPRP